MSPHCPITRAGLKAGTAFAALLLAVPAFAQEEPNPLLRFDFSSTLRASDNYGLDEDSPGDSYFWDNRLGFGYRTTTGVSTFTLDGGATLRFADLPDRDYDPDVDDIDLNLGYVRDGANARLTTEASYNRSEIAFFDPLSRLDDDLDELEGEDLIQDNTGTRETWGADIMLETGLSDPLGFSLGYSNRTRNYIDTVDPDYYDSETNTYTAAARLILSPVATTTLTLTQEDYTNEDVEETDRTARTASLGLTYLVSPVLTFDGSLGYSEIETEENIGLTDLRSTEKKDGLVGTLGLTRALPTGSIGVAFQQTVDEDGDRSTLRVTRAMELPNGSLQMSLGATKGEESDTGFVGDLAYVRDLPNGNFRATLSQDIGTDDDEAEETRTRATLGLSHDLTALSSMDLSVNYIDISSDGPEGDRSRGQFRAAYNHDLTSEWQLSGGYTYTRATEDTEDDATENAIFLTLKRSFQTRP